MARQNTAKLLDEITREVERFQKFDRKSKAYAAKAGKVKASIFRALEAIPKEDFALYSEKIEKLTKRLNKL